MAGFYYCDQVSPCLSVWIASKTTGKIGRTNFAEEGGPRHSLSEGSGMIWSLISPLMFLTGSA
jgi:hypothetical protein